MSVTLNKFMDSSQHSQNQSLGRLYQLEDTITFATGETTKLLMLVIPAAIQVEVLSIGISFKNNFDNTFKMDMYQSPVGFTAATAFNAHNLNRNFSAGDKPCLFYIFNCTGSLTSYGVELDKFVPTERKVEYKYATNYAPMLQQKVMKIGTDYGFVLTRTTDTNELEVEVSLIGIQNT